MDPKKLDRIISIVREQMVANAPGTQGGFSGSSDSKGPTAGFDPVMGMTRRKKYASLGVGSRKRWMKKKPW
ncbi:MAG: hypothetical protein EBU90_03035 [Proteobacteria bacterium]|nr:hypothetical protein [Pseudomonadota bacterium]